MVAATNRDLGRMVAEREFHSDLFYRVHVFRVVVPPLRETNGVFGGPKGTAARPRRKRTTLQSRMQKPGIARQTA